MSQFNKKIFYFNLIFSLFLGSSAMSVEPKEMLNNIVLEKRARSISKQLRCVVCQNESIDDSSAIIARDMRKLVREKILSGETDQEIVSYMRQRYGDFVLLKPRFALLTFFLWFSPIIILLIGLTIFYKQRIKKKINNTKPLSLKELKQLEEINKK